MNGKILKWMAIVGAVFLISLANNSYANSKSLSLAYGLENYDFQPLLDEFTAQSGIKIDITPFKNNELKSELIQRAKVQQLPDIIIVPSDFTGLNQINVSKVPDSLFLPGIKREALASSRVNGISRGIPIVYGNHLVLFYNKKLISQPAETWRELLLQKSQLAGDANLIAWNYLEMYWFIPFLGTYGDYPFQDGKVTLATDGMVKALNWYRNFSDLKVIDMNCGYDCAKSQFLSGKLAYTINGSWSFFEFTKELGENLGVALLPKLGEQRMKPYFSSHVLAFPDNSLEGPKAEMLKKLALFLQSEKAQLMVWNQMRSIPTNSNTLKYLMSKGDKNLSVMLEQLEYSEPMPNEHNMAIVWEAMLKGTTRYLGDVFDAKSASEYMQYVAEKSIQNANE